MRQQRIWNLEPPEMEPPMLLTPGQAERLIGIRAERLLLFSRMPNGPATVRLPGRNILYDRRDLLDWIARHRHKVPPAEPAEPQEKEIAIA
jgi:hypothetical protein